MVRSALPVSYTNAALMLLRTVQLYRMLAAVPVAVPADSEAQLIERLKNS